MELVKKGGVKEAKRMLEDRNRREKREQKLAEVRKPLITTPSRKRTRQEGGNGQLMKMVRKPEPRGQGSGMIGRCHRHQLGPSW